MYDSARSTSPGTFRKVIPLVAAAALLLGGRSAGAQNVDGWQAYFGCWQPIAAFNSASVAGEPGHVVCITPVSGAAAVQFITVLGDTVVDRLRINTTGDRAPVAREGCTGWESAKRGLGGRIYTRSEYTCDGGVARNSSGLISMLSPTEWMDVQTVSIGESGSVTVQRYRNVDPPAAAAGEVDAALRGIAMAISSARLAASTRVSLDDVIDASANAAPATVEGWLLERRQGFAVEARDITRLARAGVPDEVVNMLVALSYPSQFQSELSRRRIALFPARETPVNSARIASPDYVAPAVSTASNYGPECRGYDYCGRSGYQGMGSHHHFHYYSPFGFHPYGYYGYGYFARTIYRAPQPIVIIIDNDGKGKGAAVLPGTGVGTPQPQPQQPQLRAINGRGYTNGNQSGSAAGAAASQGGAQATALGTSPALNRPPAQARVNGGGTATRAGYTNGSAGGSTVGGTSNGSAGGQAGSAAGSGGTSRQGGAASNSSGSSGTTQTRVARPRTTTTGGSGGGATTSGSQQTTGAGAGTSGAGSTSSGGGAATSSGSATSSGASSGAGTTSTGRTAVRRGGGSGGE